MKLKKLLFSIAVFSTAMASTAFAGTWRTGADPHQDRWWYDNDDGTFACNGWKWIDGNGDGTAECYYFDADGWMLTDTMTPDGYTVNADGAWIQNGTVMSQTHSATSPNASATTETSRLRSVLVMEKGRPIHAGVPMDIYAPGQLTGTKYDIVSDSTPESLQDESTGYYYKYDDRGFLVRTYHTYGLSRARMADVYKYDDNGRLTAFWTVIAGASQDAATMEPSMADPHTEYVYDSSGKLEKTIKTNNSSGKITTYYYYDSYGRLTKTVEDRSEYGRFDGGQALYGLEYETRYTYNDSARTITIESESTKKDSGLGANLITETYYCDKSGRIVKCSLRSGSDYTYVYDENGQVIRSEMRGADGSLATYTEYIYQ